VACASVDRQEESSRNVEFMALTHPLASSRRKTIDQKRVLLPGLLDIQLAMRNPPTKSSQIHQYSQPQLMNPLINKFQHCQLARIPCGCSQPSFRKPYTGGKKKPRLKSSNYVNSNCCTCS
jgi:hypothetical protein